MKYISEEEKLRKADIYEEMKDLKNLKEIFGIKRQIFEQRAFKLRGLVLENLKSHIKMQLRALDEEYKLIGLDEECWTDEEHFLHDLSRKIEKANVNNHTREQKEKIIKGMIDIEMKERGQIEILLTLIKEHIKILYEEIRKLEMENLLNIKGLLEKEEKKIIEIGNIINIEEKEEEGVSRKDI